MFYDSNEVLFLDRTIIFFILVTDLIMTREYFAHREDKLYNRIHNHQSTWITEYFHPGRAKCVKGLLKSML